MIRRTYVVKEYTKERENIVVSWAGLLSTETGSELTLVVGLAIKKEVLTIITPTSLSDELAKFFSWKGLKLVSYDIRLLYG